MKATSNMKTTSIKANQAKSKTQIYKTKYTKLNKKTPNQTFQSNKSKAQKFYS